MKILGNEKSQECRRWLNNRAENSHQPFRRREGPLGGHCKKASIGGMFNGGRLAIGLEFAFV